MQVALHLEEEVSRYLASGDVPTYLPGEMACAVALPTLGVGVGEAQRALPGRSPGHSSSHTSVLLILHDFYLEIIRVARE